MNRRLTMAAATLLLLGPGVSPASGQRASTAPTLAVSFQRAFAVGGSDDETLELSSLFPQQVAATGQGGFLVLNAAEGYVAQFDSRGRLVRRLGRKGGGPGEFQFPMNLTSDARNRIWVYDAGKRALVGFDPNGAPLDEVSVRGRGLMQRVAWMADGDGVFERTRGDTVFLLRARGADTADVARMVRAAARPVDRTACGLLGDTRRPVFSAEFHWAASPAMVAFVDDAEFKVTLIRGSRPPEVLRRDATPTRATNELATRALGGGDSTFVNGRGWCTTPTSLILEGAGVAARIPAYSRVLIDAESRVWVLRFPVPGAAPEADVYSPTRGFLGTVSLGGRNPVAFLTDGRMASIEHDADAVPVVVVYDVKWPG